MAPGGMWTAWCYTVIGTGVGSAIIIDGQLYRECEFWPENVHMTDQMRALPLWVAGLPGHLFSGPGWRAASSAG